MPQRKPSPPGSGTNPAQVIGAYQSSEVAESYSDRWSISLGSRISNWLEQRVARRALAGIGRVESILDCPCGTGRMWRLLDGHCERLHACDASGAMLGVAIERNPEIALADSVVAPVQELPHASESVDVVFCWRLMHHFSSKEDRVAVLSSLARVTRRHVVFTTRIGASPKPIRSLVRRLLRKRRSGRVSTRFSTSLPEIESELAQAGLNRVRTLHKTPFGSPLVVIICEKVG